ncbi:hypothetical protein C0V75_13475 [Tabrizicola sp. TH137]|uniref:DUF6473 family protein n=1 Tax=Tabrizicola sp. TH137 TaxID=2067452 RepID=UPI000C7D001A|nr:DUF6473 family protein [Tabrizicola sp. TH137]PLL11910.1 hypothetical protein C0V75_13475 [Tabrizicola sp. TH137]
MAYDYAGEGSLDYMPCRYGRSRLLFRGPRRDLSGWFVAVLGGIEAYGRYIPQPYPALLEAGLGGKVVNLGCPNAGPDAWLGDPAVMDVVQRAAVVVVQVPGAADLSNRFYTVHPRRNDRFLRASPLLQTIYRGVDFTDFSFTRHMLRSLFEAGPERFGLVAEELRSAWCARMAGLLAGIPGRKVLLWMAEAPPGPPRDVPFGEPLLVDAGMMERLAGRVDAAVTVVPSAAARARGMEGMVFPPMAEPAARGVPGVAVHEEVAAALLPVLRGMM